MTQTQSTSRLRRRAANYLAAAFAVACLCRPARAEPTPEHRRVLILVDKPGDLFIERIKAEISSLGLDIVVHAPIGSLDADARAEHAIAAIRLLPSRKGVEVWMADETSGRSLLRQVIVDETPGGPDQNLIALQTAELLRTSLFPKTDNAPHPPVATAPAPEPVAVVAPPPPPQGETSVQAAFGLLGSPGGVPSALQVWLSVGHMWNRRFGFAVDVGAPVRRGTLTGPEGSADIGAFVVGAELLARLKSEGTDLFLTTGLGAALASIVTSGHLNSQAGSQLLASSPVLFTGLVYLRATAGWKPSSWSGLGLTGLVGTTTSRVKLKFAGNDAADWGLPVLAAFAFAEVDWH